MAEVVARNQPRAVQAAALQVAVPVAPSREQALGIGKNEQGTSKEWSKNHSYECRAGGLARVTFTAVQVTSLRVSEAERGEAEQSRANEPAPSLNETASERSKLRSEAERSGANEPAPK